MSKTDFLKEEIFLIKKYLHEYRSGDLILIAEILTRLKGIEEVVNKSKSLKKLAIPINYLKTGFKVITTDKSKEDLFLSLSLNLVRLLEDYFAKTLSVEDFEQAFNNLISQLKEITSDSIQPLETIEEIKNFYSEDYFSSLVDDNKLLSQFFEEAHEHLDQAQFSLLELEYDSTNLVLINDIFRDFHTIKGSASFLGLKNIEELCHHIEEILDLVRKNRLSLSKELLDIVFFGIELIRTILDIMQVANFNKQEMVKSFKLLDIYEYLRVLQKILNEYPVKKIGEILCEFGKISPGQIGLILDRQKDIKNKKTGELLIEEKMVTAEDVSLALKKQNEQRLKMKRMGYVKVSYERLNTLIDIVGELVTNQSMLKQEIIQNNIRIQNIERTLTDFENITRLIKNIVLSMGMSPVEEIFNKLKIVARNTANELGKTVIVHIVGGETELDRNVMENIYDPLIHLVRNAISHGIETPAEREKNNKDKIGHIFLKAEHKGSGIEITVQDDGRGIDRDEILKKAFDLNLLDNKEGLSDREIFNLLFLPGFSTSENVTTVSGRGVGLDVVKKNIEQLHGRVEIKTTPGKGTAFIITLPLTLAIIEGFVTRVKENKYVFPFNLVDEILILEKNKIIRHKERNSLYIFHRETHLPVIFLQKELANAEEANRDILLSLIINFNKDKYCIVVDEIFGKQEIVIKNLGGMLAKHRMFSGGTIFGDGSIGFVIDMQGLLETVQ